MRYLYLLIVAIILTGCGDVLGATTRTRIDADARVQVAQREADSRARVAQHEADARVGVAKHEADAKKYTAGVWAGALPLSLGVLGMVVAGCLFVMYAGKAHVIYVDNTTRPRQMLPPPPARPMLAQQHDPYGMLQDYADSRGLRIVPKRNGTFLLVLPSGEIAERRQLLTDSVHDVYGG